MSSTSNDPVAAKSGFLCMYMSNHPDTLVSYVKYGGKVKGQVSTARMKSIDTNGMDLSYTTTGKEEKQVRVLFDPPLAGYEEVKPRLLALKVDAEEALGMSRAPQITEFHVDTRDVLMIVPAIALLFYTTFAPVPQTSPIWTPGVLLREFVGPGVISIGWGVFLGAHALESLYTLSLCRKHRTGLVTGAKYVLTTLLLGFPGFKRFRQVIQEERINSIMKGQ